MRASCDSISFSVFSAFVLPGAIRPCATGRPPAGTDHQATVSPARRGRQRHPDELIGGYPVGARMTVQLLDAALITQKQAQRMLFFCVNSGPAFLISAVGSAMLRSDRRANPLRGTHCQRAADRALHALSRIQRDDERKPCCSPYRPVHGAGLVDAATQGCAGIVSICVWVILFSCIAALFSLLPLPSTLRILLQCFLEVTSGCASAAGKVPLPALALVLGWGGICVHCQVLHDVSKTKLSLPLFFCGRVANGLLACLISAGLFRLFPCETPVFLTMCRRYRRPSPPLRRWPPECCLCAPC